LDDNLSRLVGMGLKFIPPVETPPKTDFNKSFTAFTRTLRMTAFFDHFAPAPRTGGEYVAAFYMPNANWQPPEYGRVPAYEEFLFHTRNLWNAAIANSNPCYRDSAIERDIRAIKQRDDIIIRPSDKNLGLVILGVEKYNAMVREHLDDGTKYAAIATPEHELITQLRAPLRPLLHDMKNTYRRITGIERFLEQSMSDSVRVPFFHVLPKVHKHPIKGRPIAGAVNWLTTYPSALLAHVLKPHVAGCAQILRDSKALIRDLEFLDVPQGAFLVTMDITALYPNMDQAKTVEAVGALPLPPVESALLCAVTEFILQNSYVQYDDRIYHQIDGMPMGTNAAVELANLFGDRFIDNHETVTALLAQHATLYRRYIDDIFIIWKGDEQSLLAFHDTINSVDEKLKFSLEYSQKSIAFLDLRICLSNGRARLATFQKTMNKYLYLPFGSNHPKAAKKGFIKGELIRYVRNSSDFKTFANTRLLFRLRLQARGYPRFFIDSIFKTVKYSDRQTYLADKEPNEETTPNGKRIVTAFLKTRFCRRTHDMKIPSILRAHLTALNSNAEMRSEIKPVVCFTRGKNLADRLTASRFTHPLKRAKRRLEEPGAQHARPRKIFQVYGLKTR
jgi:hypothetical protein